MKKLVGETGKNLERFENFWIKTLETGNPKRLNLELNLECFVLKTAPVMLILTSLGTCFV